MTTKDGEKHAGESTAQGGKEVPEGVVHSYAISTQRKQKVIVVAVGVIFLTSDRTSVVLSHVFRIACQMI